MNKIILNGIVKQIKSWAIKSGGLLDQEKVNEYLKENGFDLEVELSNGLIKIIIKE